MTAPCEPFLLEIAIEPTHASDRPALLAALDALDASGPRLDPESRQVIVRAHDEAKLDTIVAALRDIHGLELRLGAPQVLYRETLARRIEIDATHKRQGEFARVRIVFAPGDGPAFESRVDEETVPPDLIAGVQRGLESARRAGALAGAPVVDVGATLIDGACHATDSSPAAFQAAAISALRHAQSEVGVLLEPIMQVEVIAPEPYVGAIRSNLSARRGAIGTTARAGGLVGIAAKVPLANLLGYPVTLRSATRGQGALTMHFSHFAPVDPPDPPRFSAAAALRIA